VTARYVVADNTQVNVEGTVYVAGEEVPLHQKEAASLLLAGTVTLALDSSAVAKKRR